MKNYAEKEMKRGYNDTLEKKNKHKTRQYWRNWETKKKKYVKQTTMAEVSPSLSVIALNGLNSTVKRQWLAGWIKKKKHDPTIYYFKETHFRPKENIGWMWKNGIRSSMK